LILILKLILFYFKGYHTLPISLSTALLMLAMHKDVQEKALKEIKTVFNNLEGEIVTLNDALKLKYLEMVVKESMRLFPPGIMVGRMTTGMVELGFI
jgi:cytochrome P450